MTIDPARPSDLQRGDMQSAAAPSGVQLFDTHSHLFDEQFAGRLDDVWRRARAAGVTAAVVIGTTGDTSRQCVEIASRYAGQSSLATATSELTGLFAAVGIQPNHVAEAAPGDWDVICQLAERPRVVAIGETGLDRYWDYAPFELQQDYFDRHLRLAQLRDLPVVIHSRNCDADILAMLRDAVRRGPLRGILHSFTGEAATAAECVELGLHISFAGMVTYPKNAALRDIARQVPAERILIETDSPYLSPHPHRSVRPNEPGLLVHTARCLAEVRGVSFEEFAALTTLNARRLFFR